MRIVRRTFANLSSSTILLGRTGENRVTRLDIDVSREQSEFPGSTFELQLSLPGVDTEPYPVMSDNQYGTVSYVVCSYDVQTAGSGKLELTMYGKNGEVLKSSVAKTRIDGSLLGNNKYSETVQRWVDFFKQHRSAISIVDYLPDDDASYGELIFLNDDTERTGLYINTNDSQEVNYANWEPLWLQDWFERLLSVEQFSHLHSNMDVLRLIGYSDGHITFDGEPVGGNAQSPTITLSEIENGTRVTIFDVDHPNGQSFDVESGSSSGNAVVETPNDLDNFASVGSIAVALNDGIVYSETTLPDLDGEIDDSIDVEIGDKELAIGNPSYKESVLLSHISESKTYLSKRTLCMSKDACVDAWTIPVVSDLSNNIYTNAGVEIDTNNVLFVSNGDNATNYIICMDLSFSSYEYIPKNKIVNVDESHVKSPVLAIFAFEELSGILYDFVNVSLLPGWNILQGTFDNSNDKWYYEEPESLEVSNNVDINEYLEVVSQSSTCIRFYQNDTSSLLDGVFLSAEPAKKKGLYIKFDDWCRIADVSDIQNVFSELSDQMHRHHNQKILNDLSADEDKLLFKGNIVGGIQTVDNPNLLNDYAPDGSMAVALYDSIVYGSVSFPDQIIDEITSIIGDVNLSIGYPICDKTSMNQVIENQESEESLTIKLSADKDAPRLEFLTVPVVSDPKNNDYTQYGITLASDEIFVADSCMEKYFILIDLSKNNFALVNQSNIAVYDGVYTAVPLFAIFAFEDLSGTLYDWITCSLQSGWNIVRGMFDSNSDWHENDPISFDVLSNIDVNDFLTYETSPDTSVTLSNSQQTRIFNGILMTGTIKPKGLYLRLNGFWSRLQTCQE